jgi:hypothetical protein
VGNSIEEALEKLSNGKKIKMYELLRTFKREGIENFVITRKKYVDVILSDYKRVLKENEELKIKNNAIKRESEAYAEYMIRLDNELNLEKEKSKYEWIRQNCLPQELVNKLYIPIQKIKDKIEEYKNMLKTCNKVKDIDRIKAINERILELQELLEGRK